MVLNFPSLCQPMGEVILSNNAGMCVIKSSFTSVKKLPIVSVVASVIAISWRLNCLEI